MTEHRLSRQCAPFTCQQAETPSSTYDSCSCSDMVKCVSTGRVVSSTSSWSDTQRAGDDPIFRWKILPCMKAALGSGQVCLHCESKSDAQRICWDPILNLIPALYCQRILLLVHYYVVSIQIRPSKCQRWAFYPKTKDASEAQPKQFCANTLCQGQCFLSQNPDIRDDVSPTAGDQIAQNYPLRWGRLVKCGWARNPSTCQWRKK